VHRTASFVLVPVPDYLETVPPSTGRSMPVMKLLSSEARNTTADASSSAVPSRPVGIIFRKYSLVSSGDPLEPTWTMGVSVGPERVRSPCPTVLRLDKRSRSTGPWIGALSCGSLLMHVFWILAVLIAETR